MCYSIINSFRICYVYCLCTSLVSEKQNKLNVRKHKHKATPNYHINYKNNKTICIKAALPHLQSQGCKNLKK